MKIILVGGGRMGQEIARRLADEGHDITVVDNNAECLEEISTGVDAMVLYGNGADYNVLTEAGVADADLLIAVTSDDSVNMLCCLTGKKLGVKNTVARVRTMEYFRQMVFLKDELGLSLVLNPEQAAAAEISRILRFPSAAKVESFAKGRAEMVEFTLAPESPLCGLRLVKLRGGNAEVKEHSVHAADAQLVQHRVKRAEVAVDERDLIEIVAKAAVRRFDGGLVAVERDEPARCQAAHDLERMAGAAERAVHINAVRLDGERIEALVQQHRLMTVVLFHIRIPTLPSRRPDSRG